MFCEELKMPMNTLNKQIDNLRKANILLQFQIKRGCYLVDLIYLQEEVGMILNN